MSMTYKQYKKAIILSISLLALTVLPTVAFAHQPRIATENPIIVSDPEISKAYYGKFQGEPVVYRIVATEPFDLYVGVLVPDIAGQKKDVSAVIIKDGKELAVLESTGFEWKKFFEPFGRDTYFEGPEYKAQAEAGAYEIRVWSSNNDSKYSLAIGEIEAFDFKETVNALTLIPQLKKDFFNKSPIDFILSPFGWGLILIMFVLAFAVGFAYRFVLRRFAKSTVRGVGKNIDTKDRLVRLAIALALLGFAITSTWNPIILFLAGFSLFEAIFSWCGFYAAIGRNSCPIN